MTGEEIQALASAWSAPIEAGKPSGDECRYEQEFEDMRAETKKLESIEGLQPDWRAVETNAVVLVTEKTKDFRVFGALCVALLKQKSFAGLAAGLVAFRKVAEDQWQTMFPKVGRLRGRAGAYEWLVQQMTEDLAERSAKEGDLEALELCLSQFQELDDFLRQYLNEYHPKVRPLRQALQTLIEQAAPKPEAVPAEPTASTTSGAVPDETAPSSTPEVAEAVEAAPKGPQLVLEVDSDESAEEAIRQARELTKRVARYHLNKNAAGPLGYHLAHVASFLGVSPDSDVTPEAPPPREIRGMRQAVEGGDPKRALGQIPTLLEDGDLNLSVLHALADALEQLGESHQAAYQMVCGEALGLYQRMDKQIDANADANEWLEGMITPPAWAAAAPEQGSDEGSLHEENEWLATLAGELKQCAKKQGLPAACRYFRTQLLDVSSMRRRFRAELALAQLCIEFDAHDVAEPLLSELHQKLRAPLEAWEPELAVEVLRALLRCHRKLKGKLGSAEEQGRKWNALWAALSRLDPAAACEER